MGRINVRAFLRGVASIVAERPAYRLGMDGTGGLCDCIGLVIGGIRRAGGTWTGTHGSNWAARNAMASLRPTDRPGLGEIVYKAREPGAAGYDLPAAYAAHPDQRDYYHAGVVTSTAPLQVTHCTSFAGGGGIKVDNLETVPGAWAHSGRLNDVDYENAVDELGGVVDKPALMWTTASSGRTVNMRSKPSKDGLVMARVPIDTQVQALSSSGDWRHVSYAGKTGWIMAGYLTAVPPFVVEPEETPLSRVLTLLTEAIELLKAL